MSAIPVYAFAAFFVVRLLRVLPYLRDWTAEGIKPIACNVCMSWWAALAAALVGASYASGGGHASPVVGVMEAAALAVPAAAGCLLLLEWAESLEPPAPPELGS